MAGAEVQLPTCSQRLYGIFQNGLVQVSQVELELCGPGLILSSGWKPEASGPASSREQPAALIAAFCRFLVIDLPRWMIRSEVWIQPVQLSWWWFALLRLEGVWRNISDNFLSPVAELPVAAAKLKISTLLFPKSCVCRADRLVSHLGVFSFAVLLLNLTGKGFFPSQQEGNRCSAGFYAGKKFDYSLKIQNV